MVISIDPVCGKEIEVKHAEWLLLYSDYRPAPAEVDKRRSADVLGRRYYFCSTACKVKFDLAPDFFSALSTRARESEKQPGASDR